MTHLQIDDDSFMFCIRYRKREKFYHKKGKT